ncbi:MAG: LutB/LldF family L-lactate oxidation iron-sulfur protein, partial [Gammaproteobacteria bacterium]|nr:LutB/LldF family L-lactate oxidation iron-sulfur protein [Gammaproteobacteria bacterium]
NALAKLPELLERLEASCTRNGMTVHWAETVEEANAIVLDIVRRHEGRSVIKGKSMVSEEMELNHHLEAHDIEALESDLGEYIVQLAGETPSHIIMPAIHKNTRQIAELFVEKLDGIEFTEDAEKLTAVARDLLRRKFFDADVGVSGVNFAVAETGTLVLVENEGNGRLTTTTPDVHVAVTGIEKVIERLEEVTPLLSLLPRSATGQNVTTYVNMISGPRREGERDGPREVHLVLLDNGRSRSYADADTRQTLQCIRCGACMNHCPVYVRIGGHAYGTVYPGPIGEILSPQLLGCDEAGALPGASTLCGACGEVCPVRIPIPKMLVRMRREAVNADPNSKFVATGAQRRAGEATVWKAWARIHATPGLYGLVTRTAGALKRLPVLGPLKTWSSVRTPPRAAGKTLHQRLAARGENR